MTAACPTNDVLSRLLEGELAGPERDALAAHLDGCKCCQHTAETMLSALPPLRPVSHPEETVSPAGREFLSRLAASGPLPHASSLFQSKCGEPPPPLPEALPQVPGYEVQEELGRGGMGVVYRARQAKLNRIVALKMILASEHAVARARFAAEAESVARLQHPGIVQVHEVGEVSGRPFFSLEFVGGGSLAQKLAGTPLPPGDAARMVETLARAMAYAHSKGIVHRDLKPANVLLAEDGSPKITDFGIAKQMETHSSHTHTGAVIGTPSYMAPEQSTSQREVGPLADVYALGAVLYECLTGRPPFKADSPLETLMQVTAEDPVPPARLNPKVPQDLETICMKCLEKKPENRYPGALELADELRRFQAGEPIRARPAGTLELWGKWARRHPAVAGLLSLLVVGTAAAIVLLSVAWQNAVAARLGEEGQRKEAEKEKLRAEAALQAEKQLRKEAEDARRAEQEQRRKFQQLSIGLVIDRASDLGERKDPARALLWLTRGLSLVGKEDAALARVLRCNLSSWQAQAHPLRFAISPADGAAWAPDSKSLITWGPFKGARRYDARTGAVLGELPHDHKVQCVAFGGDGTTSPWRAATGSDDRTARVWDLGTGKPASLPLVHPALVHRVALSPNGKLLLTACGEAARLWDVEKGKTVGEPMRHAGGVTVVAFSPDGKTLLTAGNDGTARVWDSLGKAVGKPMKHRYNWVTWAAFSPDGKRVVTAVPDTVSLWDASTGDLVAGPRERGHNPKFVWAWGQPLLVMYGPSARKLDSKMLRELLVTPPHEALVTALDTAPNGQTFLTGSKDQTARIWKEGFWGVAQQVGGLLPHQNGVVGLSYSPDGKSALTVCSGHIVRVWGLRPPDEPLPLIAWNPGVSAWATLSPDGKTALTARDKITLFRVTPSKGAAPLHKPFDWHGNYGALAFDGKGETLLLASSHQALRLLDVVAGKLKGSPIEALPNIECATLSEDGKTILVGAGPKAALYDARTGKRRGQIMDHPGARVARVALSPDASVAVTATRDGAIRLWDTAGKPLGRKLAHLGAVRALAFSRDGKRLLSGSEDRTARLWDVATGKPLTPPLGHARAVNAVAVSPDVSVLLTGVDDGCYRAWDAATGKPLGPPIQLRTVSGMMPVNALAFAADGKTFTAATRFGVYSGLKVPRPMEGSVERLVLWAQVLTGLKLDKDGTTGALDGPAWAERKRQLDRLGGPP
jgi:WD40 repeat protein/tRNA A-37 threonylcarbamoyl transferase component Bud32